MTRNHDSIRRQIALAVIAGAAIVLLFTPAGMCSTRLLLHVPSQLSSLEQTAPAPSGTCITAPSVRPDRQSSPAARDHKPLCGMTIGVQATSVGVMTIPAPSEPIGGDTLCAPAPSILRI